MSQLAKTNGQVPITKTELHNREKEIRSVADHCFEEFYQIGQRLHEIKTHRLYEAEGFGSWESYCKSGRLDWVRRQADNIIRASEIRPLLPVPPSGSLGKPGAHAPGWTEYTVRPLTHPKLEPRDVKRIAGKVVTYCKRKSVPLTAAIVKQFVDEDLGVPRKKQKVASRRLDAAAPESELERVISMVRDIRVSLEMMSDEWWENAEEASPGIVKRLTTELGQLAKFCKEVV